MRPALTLALVLLVACAGGARREGAALVAAVDAYRRAEGAAKAQAGRAIGAVECHDARVCAARQACAATVEPTARALSLKEEAARGVGELERGGMAPDSPEARSLPGKLDEAERLLVEGRDRMRECDARLVELRIDPGV